MKRRIKDGFVTEDSDISQQEQNFNTKTAIIINNNTVMCSETATIRVSSVDFYITFKIK